MSLYETLNSDMKEAMKNHDKETLSTIRMLKSAIDLNKINNKLESVTDELVIDTVSKQVKTHKESIKEFTNANRLDLVSGLEREIKYLEKFLPEQLSEEEIRTEIDKVFDIVKPAGKSDMGKIMKELTSLKGRADMKLVNTIVNEKLS